MSQHRKRILIAEDNWRLRTVLRAAFGDKYDVVAVPDGTALAEELQQHSYQLVITDLNLPGRSGAVVLEHADEVRLGQQEIPGLAVPALVITGMDSEDEDYQHARRLPNVLGVFQKPLDLAKLQQTVDEILGGEEEGTLDAQSLQALDESTPRLLVVDDDPGVFQAASNALERAGFQVRGCRRTAAALLLCQSGRFDLVLVSFVLEDELADEFLDDLSRTLGPEHCPPVVILNGLGEAVTIARFAALPNVKGILPKPLEAEPLLALVQRLVGRNHPACAGPFRPLAS
jgi:DNA-binding response OmpR family regulator